MVSMKNKGKPFESELFKRIEVMALSLYGIDVEVSGFEISTGKSNLYFIRVERSGFGCELGFTNLDNAKTFIEDAVLAEVGRTPALFANF